MSPRMWRLLMNRIEECWELVDEVKALDLEVRVLRDTVNQRDAEIGELRALLVTETSRRTLGGSPPGYSNRWANIKFDGPTPPPFEEAS